MSEESKNGTEPADVARALLTQSNALVGQDAGLQQCLLLVAAGLFAIAAEISEANKIAAAAQDGD